MHITLLSFLTLFAITGLADVKFLTPTPGTTLPGNKEISVTWEDGGGIHALHILKEYTLSLMVGGDSEKTAIALGSVNGDHSTSQTRAQTFKIARPDLGPGGKNAYFLQIESAAPSSTTVINYSRRFTIPGMTGYWTNTTVEAAYHEVQRDSMAVPPSRTINQDGLEERAVPAVGAGAPVAAAPAAGVPAAGAAQFGVPYSMQTTGVIKYAPMLQNPGTAITATNTAPLYQTSSWHLATAAVTPGSFIQTITQPETAVHSTEENPQAAASSSPNAMEKFLNRWKD